MSSRHLRIFETCRPRSARLQARVEEVENDYKRSVPLERAEARAEGARQERDQVLSAHAKRRPGSHLRKEPMMDAGVRVGTLGIVCGPFVRWHAEPDPLDADRPDPRGLGHVEREWLWDEEDYDHVVPDYGISEVPF